MARPKIEEDRPSKIDRSERPKRVPINGHRDVLSVQGKEAGWHYCWVNEDQVPRYEAGWYDFVEHDVVIGDRKVNAASQIGHKISLAVGNGVTAYLMRCREEDYQADMKERDDEIAKSEQALKARLNSKEDGQYGKVDFSRERPKY